MQRIRFAILAGSLALLGLIILAVLSAEPDQVHIDRPDGSIPDQDAGRKSEALPRTQFQVKDRLVGCHATILVYHHIQEHYRGEEATHRSLTVSPEGLDAQFSYLEQNGYNVVSFEQLADCLDGTGSLPTRAVVINFDDGWKNQYRSALPLLREHQLPATFFVTTGCGSGCMGPNEWREIAGTQQNGGPELTIGAHSCHHPMLTRIFDPVWLEKEIAGSKQTLEDEIGTKVDLFAYPFGLTNKRVEGVVERSGFRAARMLGPEFCPVPQTRYSLYAVQVPDSVESLRKILER